MKNQREAARRLGGALELTSHRVVIRLPNPKLFQLAVRTAILALVLLSFPWIKSSASILQHHHHHHRSDSAVSDFLADLRRLGLLKPDGRGVFLGDSGSLHTVLISNRVEPVERDLESAIADSTVDFLFFDGDVDFDLADRVVKGGGILAVRLSVDGEQFVPSPNYKIVHTSRRFDSTAIVAVRKISVKKMNNRKLLESKKQALSGLEDAVLEPPTKKKYRQKTRYLPDLLGGSTLADYPRRVFLDVGPAGRRSGSEGWFEEHYPKKNLEFEVIRIEEAEAGAGEVGMNEWAKRNLGEKEYVVMKAEAEVVEEMVKGGTIGLVDELFLECKNQWWERGSKRAYWECLSLYGRLRDEGIAVHQWWD